ncbi:hypothetical protein BDK51DRAFT_33625, partial [Blyttiomyces helicus]
MLGAPKTINPNLMWSYDGFRLLGYHLPPREAFQPERPASHLNAPSPLPPIKISDVRKQVVWNIETNEHTLPAILTRARDIDPVVRKIVYDKIAADLPDISALTIEQRDGLLAQGLSDRDATVKKASAKMLCNTWVKQCDDNLLEFLGKMDVLTSPASEESVKTFLAANPTITIPSNDEAWDDLYPELVFFIRCYIAFCRNNNREEDMEAALPPLYKHVELLRKHSAQISAIDPDAEEDDQIVQEFILGQLIAIAEMQDYSDEMGRRDMLLCL